MSTLYLGKNLKYLRSIQKLTQKELASKLGVSLHSYNNLEKNLREPDILTLKKLSIYYDLIIDELIDTEIYLSNTLEIESSNVDILKKLVKSDITIPFLQNLKKLRSLKGQSRKKVAEELNVPYSTYAGWENGFREPDISILKNLALYYKISINDLLSTEVIAQEEDKIELLSRLSQSLFETYMSVPDEYKIELEKQLIQYMHDFKAKHKNK